MSQATTESDHRLTTILWTSVLVPVALLLLAAAHLSSTVTHLLHEAERVQHTDDVINQAQQCLKLCVDMETGIRGFQITGDPVLLEPYTRASDLIGAAFSNLENFVTDNPRQSETVNEAREAHALWWRFGKELIQNRTSGGDYQSVELNLRGKEYFDQVRHQLDAFIGEEERLKAERAHSLAGVESREFHLRIVVFVALGLVISWLTRRQISRVASMFTSSERVALAEAEAARQRAAEFKSIFEHAPLGVLQSDPHTGLFLRCNPAFCELVGYSEDELTQKLTSEALTHLEDRAEHRRLFSKLQRGELDRYAIEKRYLRKNGEIIWATVTASLIRAANGDPLRIVSVVVDLTARRIAEDALRISEDRLRLATEAAEVGTWDWDRRTDRLTWSDKCKQIFGLPTNEEVTYSEFIRTVRADDRAAVESAVEAALMPSGSGRYNVELRAVRPSGELRWINSRGLVVFEERNGQRVPVRFIGIAVDITDLKVAEAALRRARDELEERVAVRTQELSEALVRAQEVDRLKSEFLATMSHELRTPLNSIIGFTEIVLAQIPGSLNAEQKRQLQFVLGSAHHLLHLINDLLDLARIESGRVEPAYEWVSPTAVVSDAIETIRPLAEQKTLILRTDLRLPELLQTDRKMLFQVLLNLLANAVKFTERGEVELRGEHDATHVHFTIRDTGIGIKEEQLTLLFAAFSQIDSSDRRRYDGTGLGLYLCKRIVEILGGTIGVKSEFGVGSSFTFTLPLNPPRAPT